MRRPCGMAGRPCMGHRLKSRLHQHGPSAAVGVGKPGECRDDVNPNPVGPQSPSADRQLGSARTADAAGAGSRGRDLADCAGRRRRHLCRRRGGFDERRHPGHASSPLPHSAGQPAELGLGNPHPPPDPGADPGRPGHGARSAWRWRAGGHGERSTPSRRTPCSAGGCPSSTASSSACRRCSPAASAPPWVSRPATRRWARPSPRASGAASGCGAPTCG